MRVTEDQNGIKLIEGSMYMTLYAGDDALADEVAASLLTFSPSVFFVILLPPIILTFSVLSSFGTCTPLCLYPNSHCGTFCRQLFLSRERALS
jgi:hypothetical protein